MARSHRYQRFTAGLAALGCLLALAACGPKDDSSASAGGPPKGGWPQAENGQLGENMCDLLVTADYAKNGLDTPLEERRTSDAANSVFCSYLIGNKLNLYLQPTAEAAKLVFKRNHDRDSANLKENGFTSQEVTGVVKGADESYADLDPLGTTEFPLYVAVARRGAFLVELAVQPAQKKPAADPKQAVADLVALLLTRVPDLGSQDTGRTHVITYTVTGPGTADINYLPFIADQPNDIDGSSVKGAKLPWKIDIPFGLTSTEDSLPLSISATTNARDFTSQVNCTIAVDGKVIMQGSAGMLTFCTETYKLT